MYKKISEYLIIGILRSDALVGKDGSIDWICQGELVIGQSRCCGFEMAVLRGRIPTR